MKIVLVNSKKNLFPFVTPLSDLLMAGETLSQRALRQIRSQRQCQYIEVAQRSDILEKDLPALVWDVDTVISDNLLKKILVETKNLRESSIFSVSIEKQEVLTIPQIAPRSQVLGVQWIARHQDLSRSDLAIQHVECTIELELSIPSSEVVYGSRQTRVTFSTEFGRRLESWADLHVVSSLIAREFVAKSNRKFSKILPKWILNFAMNSPRIVSRVNKIGKRCKIHPTAILEGCVVGDDVEIGAYCYLRSSWIGNSVVLGERCSIKTSTVEAEAMVVPSDVFNSHVGRSTTVVTGMLYQCVIGANVFLGGGCGFSDFNAAGGNIQVKLPEGNRDSGTRTLASAVGEGSFIGAGLLFMPGMSIPAGSRILNSDLIEGVPQDFNQVYVSKANRLIQIPKQFIQSPPSGV